jgi:hypothetical protein
MPLARLFAGASFFLSTRGGEACSPSRGTLFKERHGWSIRVNATTDATQTITLATELCAHGKTFATCMLTALLATVPTAIPDPSFV